MRCANAWVNVLTHEWRRILYIEHAICIACSTEHICIQNRNLSTCEKPNPTREWEGNSFYDLLILQYTTQTFSVSTVFIARAIHGRWPGALYIIVYRAYYPSWHLVSNSIFSRTKRLPCRTSMPIDTSRRDTYNDTAWHSFQCHEHRRFWEDRVWLFFVFIPWGDVPCTLG